MDMVADRNGTGEPIQNDEVIRSSLTKNLGAFGKITLLKNNAGMFIANCLRKELCALMEEKYHGAKLHRWQRVQKERFSLI